MRIFCVNRIIFLSLLLAGLHTCSLAKEQSNPDSSMMRENLIRHVEILAKHIGPRNSLSYEKLERAATYIKKELEGFGYITEEQVYLLGDKPYRNIIANKPGAQKRERIIVVCAHYDTVFGSPGADDNASGVAGLLELARLLADRETNKTVKFIAFTNEEPPFFMGKDMGSFRYAREARKRREDIEAVICLESVGFFTDKPGSQSHPFGLGLFYPNKGNFISFVSNLNSAGLVKKVFAEFRKTSDLPAEYLIAPISLVPAISFSDHWSFWKFGYKAIMVTDTAFYRNPYYHTHLDTPDKLDYDSLSKVISGLHQSLLSLIQ